MRHPLRRIRQLKQFYNSISSYNILISDSMDKITQKRGAGFKSSLQRVAVDRFQKSRYNGGVRWAR